MLDYLITEAVSIKASHEEAKAHKEHQRTAETEAKRKEAMAKLNKYR